MHFLSHLLMVICAHSISDVDIGETAASADQEAEVKDKVSSAWCLCCCVARGGLPCAL